MTLSAQDSVLDTLLIYLILCGRMWHLEIKRWAASGKIQTITIQLFQKQKSSKKNISTYEPMDVSV